MTDFHIICNRKIERNTVQLGPIICFSAVSQVCISLVTNKVFKTTRDSSFAQNGENSVIGTLLIFPSS